jgi:hypothetical protein
MKPGDLLGILLFFRNLAFFILGAIPVALIIFTALSCRFNSNLLFYTGIGISGILTILLLWIVINFILIIFFPKSEGFGIRWIFERLEP